MARSQAAPRVQIAGVSMASPLGVLPEGFAAIPVAALVADRDENGLQRQGKGR